MFFTTRQAGRTILWRTDWEIYTLKLSELQAETEFWSLGFVFWGTVDQSFTLRRNVLAIGLELELRREGQNFGESCYFSNLPLVKWHTLHLMLSFIVRNVISLLIKIYIYIYQFSSVQFSPSVVSSFLQPHELQHARPPCPSPTPGDPQTHVHWVGDAIQRSHPLSSPSPPAPNPSQNQGLFQWVFPWCGQSIGVSALASVLPMNTQDWSPLGWTGWVSLQSKGLSRVFSNTTVQKHQFFGAQLSSQSNSHIHTWPLEKYSLN